MEYNSALKKADTAMFSYMYGTGQQVSQGQKGKYRMFSFICEI